MADFNSLNELTEYIESKGLRWDVGMISHDTYEARIWKWPNVIGRVRTTEFFGVFNLLLDALIDANED